ncbi:MAG TPA: hypothetical protein PKD91_06360 [Bacteroidia bacterium]|nr:hypothetical protein [Bacteroidia bacterium]
MSGKVEITPKMKFIAILVGLAALSRLIPHELNFTPIGAIALFAGAYIKDKKLAFTLPLITLLLSDILLQLINGTGFYRDMIFVYGSFGLVVALGFYLRGRENSQTIVVASLISSIVFFLISNFGTWLMYDMYPKTGAGLMSAYVAGIPFFRGTFIGDLFYCILLFGSYAVAKWRFPAMVRN